MNRTKIDKTDADDEQLCQWQDALSGEIIQELARVIFRRALRSAEAELDKLKERTTETMTGSARGPKHRAEAVLADQYRAEEGRLGGEE